MRRLSRSDALKVAAILSFLLGLFAFAGTLPFLAMGARALEEGSGFTFLFVTFVLAILRIITAFGVWLQQRWGIVVTIVVNAIDAILAMPGLLYAPKWGWWMAVILGRSWATPSSSYSACGVLQAPLQPSCFPRPARKHIYE
jgi:hypothetical protein